MKYLEPKDGIAILIFDITLLLLIIGLVGFVIYLIEKYG